MPASKRESRRWPRGVRALSRKTPGRTDVLVGHVLNRRAARVVVEVEALRRRPCVGGCVLLIGRPELGEELRLHRAGDESEARLEKAILEATEVMKAAQLEDSYFFCFGTARARQRRRT